MEKTYKQIARHGTDMVEFVDTSTGEVFLFREGESYRIVKTSTMQKRSQYLARRSNENFIWFIYDDTKKLFEDIDPALIIKLTYLATYMNYDNALPKTSKKTIERKLNLSVNAFYQCYDKLIDEHLLINSNSKYSITSEYFGKGKLDLPLEKSCVRLFIQDIRELYEKHPVRNHKQIGYMFKLIPYINKRFNTICKNPHEKNFNKIKPLKPSEVCDIVGYNKSHAKRLMQDLSDKLNLISCTEINDKTYITVNPKICYGGDSISDAEQMFTESSHSPVNKM